MLVFVEKIPHLDGSWCVAGRQERSSWPCRLTPACGSPTVRHGRALTSVVTSLGHDPFVADLGTITE